MLDAMPLPAVADIAFFVAVWSAPMIYMPALGVTPPPAQWGGKQLAMDATYHLVYAAAVALAWRAHLAQAMVAFPTDRCAVERREAESGRRKAR